MPLYPVMLITFAALFSKRTIMSVSKFHSFQSPTDSIELPEAFTNPFHYTPHPLCLLATKEVQAYLETRGDWREELEKGKMFGVLVVRKPTGEIGFLAAFSGNLAIPTTTTILFRRSMTYCSPTDSSRSKKNRLRPSTTNSKRCSIIRIICRGKRNCSNS